MLPVIRGICLSLLLLAGGCALTGDYTHDEKVIQQDIVAACLASPLFKAAEGPIEVAFPATTLPIMIANSGVAIVCADPARFAATDAGLDDWVIHRASRTAAWVKKILHV